MGGDGYGAVVRKLNRVAYFGSRDNYCIKPVAGNLPSANGTI